MKNLCISLFIFLLAGATVSSAFAEEAKTFKIGVMLPLTGPFARYGEKMRPRISSLTDDRISFVFEDEGCDPQKAVAAYKKLSEFDHINFFIGPWCGSPQSAIAPMLKNKKQIAVLPSSAPEAVFALSGGRMYSTQDSIEQESTYLAKEVNTRGIKSVSIIFKENQFSRAHETAFKREFKGTVQATYAYTSDDIGELKAIALKIKSAKPEALFVPDAFPLMAGLLKEIKAIGITDLPVFSVYSAQSEDVLRVVGPAGEGLIYSYPLTNGAEAIEVFPLLAASLIAGKVKECNGDSECVKAGFDARFGKNGVFPGMLSIKTIKDGKFVTIAPILE